MLFNLLRDAKLVSFLRSLTELMEYANRENTGRWACQSSNPEHNGVYGNVYNTIESILEECFGADIARESMDCINYGGNYSWFDDLETAIEETMQNERFQFVQHISDWEIEQSEKECREMTKAEQQSEYMEFLEENNFSY